MLTGGFLGFVIAFGSSLSSSGDINLALRNGMIGCLIIGLVCRILYRQVEAAALVVLEREWQERQRREEEDRAENKNIASGRGARRAAEPHPAQSPDRSLSEERKVP